VSVGTRAVARGASWLLAGALGLTPLAARHALAQDGGARDTIRPPASSRLLRVCADPNNLPFSNERGEGFENRIAELLADRLGATLRYTWAPQRRGFVRTTLDAGACDLVMGVPSGYDRVRTTQPYYRSTYAFVYRADRGHVIRSLADSVLHRLRIGVHLTGESNPPPAQALAARGIIDNVVGYTIYGDYGQPDPPARLVEAVASDDVDVAIVWGPLAGYFAPRQDVPLSVVPVPAEDDLSGQQWTFAIAMGVRRADRAFAAELDRLLVREREGIRRILDEYGVPRPAAERRGASADHVRP
jgi:quinoprotein dehydrogenase-associated probable ABC transporter substrate-binding protein